MKETSKNINAITHIQRITRQIIFPILLTVGLALKFSILKIIKIAIKPSKHKITRTKAMIYIASTPFLLNSRSHIPQIKKANESILAPMLLKRCNSVFEMKLPFFIKLN